MAVLAEQARVGARLFYALYHHPRIIDLIKSEFWSVGLQKAYMTGQDAFTPRRG